MSWKEDLAKTVTEQLKASEDSILEAVAHTQHVSLIQRLNSGLDANDKKMELLSPAYAKKQGRSRTRTLKDTGQMRDSIKVVKSKGVYHIAMPNNWAQQKAAWNSVKHTWWGISPNDLLRINAVIMQINEQMRSKS